MQIILSVIWVIMTRCPRSWRYRSKRNNLPYNCLLDTSMSNADYIVGKTWGIVKVFITLNIITLLFTAFLNILINKSPFDLFPYLFYLLTISVPSLLFVLGLSFTAMWILKNQAVTFIVMLGIIGTVFFDLTDTLYGVFDFFGVNIPAIFSDVTGHALSLIHILFLLCFEVRCFGCAISLLFI